ncbi:TPA: hypothetical protein ACH3X2_012163 [Trebouxia sp. C0005]
MIFLAHQQAGYVRNYRQCYQAETCLPATFKCSNSGQGLAEGALGSALGCPSPAAWLDPVHLPAPEHLICNKTGKPLNFLLQVYAPPPQESPEAFHRVIFLFISQQGSQLALPGAAKAFRCQLPRSNPYYSPEPPTPKQRLPPALQAGQVAQVASIDPWQVVQHEAALAAGETAATLSADPPTGVQLYKELEMLVEPESQGSTAGSDQESHVQQLVRDYEGMRGAEGELTEQDMPSELLAEVEANQTEDDRQFAHFAAVVAEAPGQCLRYCFDEGAAPLWPSCKHLPTPEDIPPCPHCGTPRRFEFQVLPQLLHHMDLDAEDPEGPDWGCIAVYSCPKSCSNFVSTDKSAYTEEFVWVQMP